MNMKDKVLRKVFFGSHNEITMPTNRGCTYNFPGVGGEKSRFIETRSDDGLILTLLKRIEYLEEKVQELADKGHKK